MNGQTDDGGQMIDTLMLRAIISLLFREAPEEKARFILMRGLIIVPLGLWDGVFLAGLPDEFPEFLHIHRAGNQLVSHDEGRGSSDPERLGEVPVF